LDSPCLLNLGYSGLENQEFPEAAKNAGNPFLVAAVLSPLFTPRTFHLFSNPFGFSSPYFSPRTTNFTDDIFLLMLVIYSAAFEKVCLTISRLKRLAYLAPSLSLRAYPNNPEQRNVIMAQTK